MQVFRFSMCCTSSLCSSGLLWLSNDKLQYPRKTQTSITTTFL